MSWMGETKVKEALIGSIHLLKRIPGYSAYEIAVKNGFVGTEKEWLASLKGEKGDIGQMEAHGGIDALGERIKNVADPVEDGDAVNKKCFDKAVADSKQYVDDKTAESTETAKAYADETFVKAEVEKIENFCDLVIEEDEVVESYLVAYYGRIFKIGRFVQGCIFVDGLARNFENGSHMFTIRKPYRPLHDIRMAVPLGYYNEVILVHIYAETGKCEVYYNRNTDTRIDEISLNFSYICKEDEVAE